MQCYFLLLFYTLVQCKGINSDTKGCGVRFLTIKNWLYSYVRIMYKIIVEPDTLRKGKGTRSNQSIVSHASAKKSKALNYLEDKKVVATLIRVSFWSPKIFSHTIRVAINISLCSILARSFHHICLLHNINRRSNIKSHDTTVAIFHGLPTFWQKTKTLYEKRKEGCCYFPINEQTNTNVWIIAPLPFLS